MILDCDEFEPLIVITDLARSQPYSSGFANLWIEVWFVEIEIFFCGGVVMKLADGVARVTECLSQTGLGSVRLCDLRWFYDAMIGALVDFLSGWMFTRRRS